MNLEKPSSEIKTVSKRGISEEEMKKSKEVIEDVEREKEIRERGELQTAAESAEKRAREKYGLLRKEGAKTEKEEKITENKELYKRCKKTLENNMNQKRASVWQPNQ